MFVQNHHDARAGGECVWQLARMQQALARLVDDEPRGLESGDGCRLATEHEAGAGRARRHRRGLT
jgi:hypothetical protein